MAEPPGITTRLQFFNGNAQRKGHMTQNMHVPKARLSTNATPMTHANLATATHLEQPTTTTG